MNHNCTFIFDIHDIKIYILSLLRHPNNCCTAAVKLMKHSAHDRNFKHSSVCWTLCCIRCKCIVYSAGLELFPTGKFVCVFFIYIFECEISNNNKNLYFTVQLKN